MKLLRKLRIAWYFFWLALKGEPVRTWRKDEGSGKYLCDGDCGRYRLHGVCTCGLCHEFKYTGRADEILRPRSSWMREDETEQVMLNVPRKRNCKHGLDLDGPECPDCRIEWDAMEQQLFKEMGWNK